MAETFRRRKVEDFIRRLSLRESILRSQLLQREFATNEAFQELTEREWLQEGSEESVLQIFERSNGRHIYFE